MVFRREYPRRRNAYSAFSGLVARLLLIAAVSYSMPPCIRAQTELGSEDDLTVMGTTGTAIDPDTEIKGFTVFGSTQTAYPGAVAGAGNVVVNGVLSVSSGAYFTGNSTFTEAGRVFILDGSEGQILSKNTDGYLQWTSSAALGDNLGSHVATTTLQMGVYGVNTSSNITAARYQINGSTVLALLPGFGSLGIGLGAGRVNAGNGNSFVGYFAGYANAAGEYNSFIGYSAGQNNNAGGGNSFVGYQAGLTNTSGNSNTFIGSQSGYGNTTGGFNSFIGYQAGYANSSGAGNSFVGYYAGKNSTANNNSFLGYYAGYNTTSGSNNAFLGFNSGFGNTTGSNNSFFGYQSGLYNTNGINNAFLGYEAGRNNGAGSGNSILGYQAGYGSSGNAFSSSTLVGYQAGYSLLNGAADNIFFGWKAGYSVTTGTGNIIIGHDKTTPAVGASNHLNIGGAVYGDLAAKTMGIGRVTQNAALDVVSTGTAHTVMAQLWRDGDGVIKASMSATGVMMADKFVGNGSGLTNLPAGAGDNLGNHIATTTLNMAGFNISGVSTVTAAGYVDAARYLINKSTVMAILPGYKSFAIGINAGILNGTNADYNLFVGEQAGESNVGGDDNAFFGYKAGYLNTASDNTFVGYEVGYYNSSGFSNVFVGHQAGFSNETGSDNTFVGKYAGGNGYNGSHSSLFGSNAGYANSGDNNSFVGSSAGHDNTTGANNSILGYQAGSENRTGSANSIFGAQAGYGVSANSYSSSTLVGYKAGFAVTTGSDNLLLGFQSGDSLTTGSRNIIIGYDEDAPAATSNDYLNIGGIVVGDMAASSVTVLGDLYANHFYGDISGASGLPSGDNLGDHVATMTITANYGIAASTVNVSGYYQINGSTVLALPGVETLALGPNAGRNNTGTYNVFVGSAAGYSATIGWENSFLGSYAGYTTADGDKNVGIGAYAGYANNSNENVFIGAYSGYNNIAPWNTFVGAYSGYANTSGSENVFIGNYAGDTNTTGNNNTFIGAWAGDDNTTGGQNVFMGYEAGYNNTTGVNNTVLGYRSGNKTQTGAANAIYGAEAGLGFTGTSFSSSTLMGYQAGYALRTGSDNIFLGYKAGYTVTTGTGNIVIGYEKTTPAAGTNNHLNIGGILYGDLSAKTIGISTRAPQAALDVVSTGTAHTEMAQIWRKSDGVIVGSMSATGVMTATRFVGDGSGLTGVGGGEEIFVSTVNAAAATPYGGVNITTNTFIQGNVGIGTAAPEAKFHVLAYEPGKNSVQMSTSTTPGSYSIAISSQGMTNINNLVIENRTSDPVGYTVGQIWLRVD